MEGGYTMPRMEVYPSVMIQTGVCGLEVCGVEGEGKGWRVAVGWRFAVLKVKGSKGFTAA